jgi:hypothetical protein
MLVAGSHIAKVGAAKENSGTARLASIPAKADEDAREKLRNCSQPTMCTPMCCDLRQPRPAARVARRHRRFDGDMNCAGVIELPRVRRCAATCVRCKLMVQDVAVSLR